MRKMSMLTKQKQMQRIDLWLPRRRGLGEERSMRLGSADAKEGFGRGTGYDWGQQMQTSIYRMGKQ